MLATANELRAWLRLASADFDLDAAELVLESAEMSVRAVQGVGKALDVLESETADPQSADLWRTAKMVALEHAAGLYPNPEAAMQRRIDQVGSVSYADSRHSARDLTRGQRERLIAAMNATGLHSLELS